MVSLTSSSASNRLLNKNHLCDVSFSSCLTKDEEPSIRKLVASSRSLNGLGMLDPQENHQYNSVNSAKMKKEADDSELGVFGAEKYFNGEMDSDKSPRLVSPANPRVHGNKKKEKVSVDSRANTMTAGTSSVHSETSWNSQKPLIQKFAKNSNSECPFTKIEKKTTKKNFLKSLGCKCSCSDDNSVDIDETGSTKKRTNSDFSVQEIAARKMNSPKKVMGLSIDNPFTFSAKSSEPASENPNIKPDFLENEEIQKKSLGVFGSVELEKRNKSFSMDKKLKKIQLDSNPRIKEDGFEIESDASSDLFEIESLTGKPNAFFTTQERDPASPTCYAPSEASIEWSVVTASAADFSVMSEYAISPVRKNTSMNHLNHNIKSSKETQRRKSSSSFLLGCNSQKAVRVSGDFHRTSTQNTKLCNKGSNRG